MDEEIRRRLVRRALHGCRERHHHGLRIVEHLPAFARGKAGCQHEEHAGQDRSVETRLPQRKTRRQQVGRKSPSASTRATSEKTLHAVQLITLRGPHPFGQEEGGDRLDAVLRARLGDTERL